MLEGDAGISMIWNLTKELYYVKWLDFIITELKNIMNMKNRDTFHAKKNNWFHITTLNFVVILF
jgi:hypothetical protein